MVVGALHAAGQAAAWLLRALVIALAGLAAAAMSAAALALQSTGVLLKTLAGLATAALPMVLGLIPGLARLLCLAFALGATGYAGVQIFQAFGGDWLALGLALLLAPTPFMTLYAALPSWPRALAAGLAALGASAAVHLAPPLLRMFMLFVIFAWLLTRRLQKGKDNDESSQNAVAEGRE